MRLHKRLQEMGNNKKSKFIRFTLHQSVGLPWEAASDNTKVHVSS